MTTTDAPPEIELAAVIDDGVLVLSGFTESDPAVVSTLAESDDLVATVRSYLRIGALAARGAHATLDTGFVERAFADLQARFDNKITEALASISATADDLLDEEDGAVSRVISDLKRDLAGLLGSTFDPESRGSVIGKLEVVLDGAAQSVDRLVRRALDPDNEDSPLRRHKTDIIGAVTDQVGELRRQVQELSTSLAVEAARAEVAERTTAKGFDYEEVVHDTIARIAVDHGDIAEHVGRASGVDGNQAGDELVTVNLEDTCGLAAAFVLEVKDRRLGARKVHEELERAISNREAAAGVAVFSREELAPATVPFQWSGNKAIVILDKDSPDEGALRLAYMWARWLARRDLAEHDALDAARVEAAITDARRALERAATVKRCHSTAKNKIEEAGREVVALVDKVGIALNAVRKEIEG